jgi:hypothetical protein
VVSFTPRPLYPQGKSPCYPFDRRLGGPRAVLDALMKRKIPSPHRESNPRTPIVQSVAQRYYRTIQNTTLFAYCDGKKLAPAVDEDFEVVVIT